MRTGLPGLLALLWLLLTLPAVVLNGLLLLNAQTARGLCFAGLAFLVLALPLVWLSQRSLSQKTLASGLVVALVVLDVGSAPRVAEFHGQTGLSQRHAGSRWSLFSMLPEVDQMCLGTWPMMFVDRALDDAHAQRLRSLLPGAYGPLLQVGSNLGDVLTPDSGQQYVYLPVHAEGERLPLVIFLHGSGGAFVAYQHLLQQWADAGRFIVVSPGFGFGNWQYGHGLEHVEDARAWAEQNLPVDGSQVTLVALSNGGRAVTRLIEADQARRWPRVVALSAVLEPDLLGLQWRDRQILIIHGADDERIGLPWVREGEARLKAAGAHVQTHLWPGEDHFLWFSRPAEVQQVALEWLGSRNQG